jgi:hypothetical protein
MTDAPSFIGQVRLDGAAWLEVCRCRTRHVCVDKVLDYEPPKGTITVERRIVDVKKA